MAARPSELAANFHIRLAPSLTTGTPNQAHAAKREYIQFGVNEILTNLAAVEAG